MKNLITKEQLQAYDTKKGTAVVDVETLPETIENRSYRIQGDKTRVFVKDTELATKEYSDGKFIPLVEKATANGVATLDANGHVPIEQMPTQALIFKGFWDASTGTFPAAGTVSGDFYIVSTEGTIDGIIYREGDWIIWDGTQWTLSRNTNAVASVNGMTGAVVLDGTNIQAIFRAETGTLNSCFSRINDFIDSLNVNIHQNKEGVQDNAYQILLLQRKDTDLQTQINSLDGDTINATYEGETDTLNTILTKVGKVKTVNNASPDANGNIQLDLSTAGVIEANALSNLGTAANATQETINGAINNQFASHTWSVSNWTLNYS